MRVLIAEDEKNLNKILAERLKAEHYSVDSCYDGQEALDYLDSAEYDAVVLDIMMPEMSGETVLKKLKEDPNFNTKVMAVTADAMDGSREKYLNLGFTEYIAKPFTRDELKEKGYIVKDTKEGMTVEKI